MGVVELALHRWHETDFEEGYSGATRDAGERRFDLACRGVAEGEAGETSPETTPPAREQAGARGGAGAGQAYKNLEEHVVREGADPIITVWISIMLRRRPELEALSWSRFHGRRR
jgi:hypothetical protein